MVGRFRFEVLSSGSTNRQRESNAAKDFLFVRITNTNKPSLVGLAYSRFYAPSKFPQTLRGSKGGLRGVLEGERGTMAKPQTQVWRA